MTQERGDDGLIPRRFAITRLGEAFGEQCFGSRRISPLPSEFPQLHECPRAEIAPSSPSGKDIALGEGMRGLIKLPARLSDEALRLIHIANSCLVLNALGQP